MSGLVNGFGVITAVLVVALSVGYYHYTNVNRPSLNIDGKTIFDFSVDRSDSSEQVKLSEFKGKKAYLIVNVASQCGLTKKNYAELQDVYEKYKDQGLEVLAFPCNNFGKQEPKSNEEICEFARGQKHVTFPILGKLQCDNGDRTHPLYAFLKSSLSGGIFGSGLLWNFAKFLCDADGVPVKRYLPITSPWSLEKDIVELLNKK